MHIVLKICVVLAFLYGLLVVGLAIAMRQPPGVFGSIMAKMPTIAFIALPFERLWMSARGRSADRPGSTRFLAKEFEQ